jgi:hypothetical protein
MRKKLKARGNEISSYQVDIVPFAVENEKQYYKIDLQIVWESARYRYDIHQDQRHPDLAVIKEYLEQSFARASQELLKVEITEYKERDYIFIEFQNIAQHQYTGRRTA